LFACFQYLLPGTRLGLRPQSLKIMMRCKKLQFLTAASLIDWLLTLQAKSEALTAAFIAQALKT